MKIVVLCDENGSIQSVMIPNPKLADQLHVEFETGGTVHRMDVGSKTAGKDVLLGKRGEVAQREAYRRLQTLIATKSVKPIGKA